MKLNSLFAYASTISVASALNDKVDTIHNPYYNPHGPSLYLKAVLRYNIEPKHPDAMPLERLIPYIHRLRSQRQKAPSNTTGFSPSTLQPDDQFFYLNPITIGEGDSAQTFNVLFDTGSPDLWLFSAQLPPDEAGNHNHTLYKAGETPTSKLVADETWNISYIDGSGASGLVYTDTLNLADISICNAVVEAANSTTSDFTDSPGDGILGLDLEQSTPGPNILPTTVQRLGNGTSPLFSALLTRQNESPGFFTFGYLNATVLGELTSNLTFISIPPRSQEVPGTVGSWTLNSEFAVLNGKRISRKGNTAILDTGTTGILLDTSLTKAVYDAIPGAKFSKLDQGYVFPASTTLLPNLTLPFANAPITLQDNADFSLGPASEDGFLYGSIQDGGGLGYDIFGTSWLNNVYAVFDLGMLGAGKFRLGVGTRQPQNK
jgi:Eukaryotic aspartyl protease